ncbi:MAG: hypothetical protein M3Z64_12120 [Verrucomicrobiota bacterium]|nr:hypothetical protein [Verrucomicrobiota bacterium]
MNTKRLLPAIVAAFILIFATDFLIHAVWLHADYDATKPLWRPEAEMEARFAWMLVGQLLCAIIVVVLWATGFAWRGTMGLAIAYGLLIGAAVSSSAIVSYVVTPMPGWLAAKWFFSGTIQGMLLGWLTFLMYKPAANAPTAIS